MIHQLNAIVMIDGCEYRVIDDSFVFFVVVDIRIKVKLYLTSKFSLLLV